MSTNCLQLTVAVRLRSRGRTNFDFWNGVYMRFELVTTAVCKHTQTKNLRAYIYLIYIYTMYMCPTTFLSRIRRLRRPVPRFDTIVPLRTLPHGRVIVTCSILCVTCARVLWLMLVELFCCCRPLGWLFFWCVGHCCLGVACCSCCCWRMSRPFMAFLLAAAVVFFLRAVSGLRFQALDLDS